MAAEGGCSTVQEVAKNREYGRRYDAAMRTDKRCTVTTDDIGDLIGRSPHLYVGLHEVVELAQMSRRYLQRFGCHAGVQKRRFDACVTQELLDDANVHAGFEKVGCPAVAHAVDIDLLLDPRPVSSSRKDILKDTLAQGLLTCLAGEQPLG